MARADSTRRVLIVEDAEDIRETLQELLEAEGYDVRCAENGQVAISLLRQAGDGELPALILLDFMMPIMDGARFRAEQLGDPRLASIPVLLMTAAGDIHAKAAELSIQACLRKPFRDIDQVLGSVAKYF